MPKRNVYCMSTPICLKAQKIQVKIQSKSYAVTINGPVIYRITQYKNAKLGSK